MSDTIRKRRQKFYVHVTEVNDSNRSNRSNRIGKDNHKDNGYYKLGLEEARKDMAVETDPTKIWN